MATKCSVFPRASAAFMVWTTFSFWAHYSARTAITTFVKSDRTLSVPSATWIAVVTVTLCQCGIGAFLLNILTRFPKSFFVKFVSPQSEANSMKRDTPEMSVIILTLSHVVATLCTNASFAFTAPTTTFVVKAFEPLTTALLSCLLLGNKLETHVIISLPMVTAGSIGFIWNSTSPATDGFGLVLAFLSNLLFGLRNIALKQDTVEKTSEKLRQLATISLNSSAILSVVVICQVFVSPEALSLAATVDAWTPAIMSAVFHTTYTVVSTCIVLQHISVTGHALANFLKRILVAVCFFAVGNTAIGSTNWAAIAVIGVGLAIYMLPNLTKGRLCQNQQHLWFTVVLVINVVIMATFYSPHLNPHRNTNLQKFPESPGSHVGLSRSLLHSGLHQDPYPNLREEDREFLQQNLVKFPDKSDFLSKRLHRQEDVVNEAIRIQDHVYSQLLGNYKKAVLVNVFEWVNKGDQFITIGERIILDKFNLSLVYYCFYPGDKCDFSRVSRSADTVVFIQGAGYIGHPAHLSVVNKAVTSFPNNRVIMFPTSICHPIAPCVNISEFAQIYGKHQDCHVMLRDRHSYQMALHYFSRNKNYLVPDSAFAVGNIRLNVLPSYDIVWIRRNDWESRDNDEMPKITDGISYQVTDWIGQWMDQSGKDFFETHQLKAFSGVLFLARARVVITDRLHAHLISTLLGKPNVVINSKTRKQANYYMTWENKLENSYLADNNKDAYRKALILLRKAKKQY